MKKALQIAILIELAKDRESISLAVNIAASATAGAAIPFAFWRDGDKVTI